MIEEKELTKLYYSIGEVADMFDVNSSLIRFWEKEFPAIQPKKNKKGNRLFSPKDILTIDRIYQLVKEEGYTLEGAKKALKSKNKKVVEDAITSPGNVALVIHRLENIKQRLLQMKK